MDNPSTYINLIIDAAMLLSGAIAFHYGLNRSANEIQERVIHALQSEIETLKDRIIAVEKDNTRLTQVISLIRSALKQRGLSVMIDGEVITISDVQGNTIQAARISGCATNPAVQGDLKEAH